MGVNYSTRHCEVRSNPYAIQSECEYMTYLPV